MCVGDFDIVMANWVGEELKSPSGLTVPECEWPKRCGNFDGHIIDRRTHGDLQGCAPLRIVQCVNSEPLEGRAVLPRAYVVPNVVWDCGEEESHLMVVGPCPPTECMIKAMAVTWHFEDWPWV